MADRAWKINLTEIKDIRKMLEQINNENYQLVEIKNFLSCDECDDIVKYADTQYYQKSLVGGGSVDGISSHRNSNQVWISDPDNTVVAKISALTSTLTGLPVDNMERLQLVRYGKGEYFYEHHDAMLPQLDRLYTILIYLNNGYRGGITHFNKLNRSIKPEKGKAVLFKSIADGKVIENSLHQGCEVYNGMKYVCNKWVHVNKVV